MHHATWFVAFPLVTALPIHHGIAPEPLERCALEAHAPAELDALLPAASLVVVRVDSLGVLLEPLARVAGEDASGLWAQIVGAAANGLGQGLAHVDMSRPAGLAVWLDAAHSPQLTLALPTNNPAALQQLVNERIPQLRPRNSGDYLAFDSAEPLALGSTSIAGFLADRDVALVVDVAGLRAAFGMLFDAALDRAEQQLDARAASDGAAGVALEQFDTWRAALRTAERFEGRLDSDGEQLEVRGRLAFANSSWTQAQFRLERRDVLALARCVDPHAALTVAQCGDRSQDVRRQLALLSSFEDALDPRWAPIANLARAHLDALAQDAGDASVLNLTLGVDGVFASLYLRSSAPQTLCERIETTLASESWRALGVNFSGPHESLSGESTWREYAAHLDVQALARHVAPQDAQDPVRIAELQSAVDEFVGAGGLRIALTAADGFAVLRVGGTAAQALECIARLRRPRPNLPAALADAFALSNEACAATIAQLDLGALLAQTESFAAGLGQALDLPVALAGERLPLTFFATASELELNSGFTLNLRQLARFVDALRQPR